MADIMKQLEASMIDNQLQDKREYIEDRRYPPPPGDACAPGAVGCRG
jgi:hypothetical protein